MKRSISKKFALALAGAVALGGVTSLASPGGKGHRELPPKLVEKFDKNQDGKLDDSERAEAKKEFKARHEARKAEMLQKFDANKDGKLDDAERKTARETRLAERFKQLDKDGNGSLSLAEFQAMKRDKKFGRHGQK